MPHPFTSGKKKTDKCNGQRLVGISCFQHDVFHTIHMWDCQAKVPYMGVSLSRNAQKTHFCILSNP